MERKEIERKVKSIIFDQVASAIHGNPEEINMEASLESHYGADSLDILEMALDLEEEFRVNIPDSDLEKMDTGNDIVNYLEKKVI